MRQATSYSTVGSPRSPFLPTSLEAFLLLLYPATLIAGSMFAHFDPATRASPFMIADQSHDPAFAPSYFAKKSNLFNQLFVKRGWFWITASYFLFLFTHASIASSPTILTRKRLQGVLRWGIATTWWIFITQWFFGPPIIDRGFTMTGGACELVAMVDTGLVDADPAKRFVSGIACKAHGGRWAGGHDISGHVFLLVLGSMFLFEEVLFVVLRASKATEERTVLDMKGEIINADAEAEFERADITDVNTQNPWDLGVKLALAIGGLSIWMLLMTAAYFHTWFEKFTGLLVALSGVFVIYFLPRFVPPLRALVGMPGV